MRVQILHFLAPCFNLNILFYFLEFFNFLILEFSQDERFIGGTREKDRLCRMKVDLIDRALMSR